MTARVYYYQQSLSRTTSTTTDFSTVKVTLPFTPTNGKTYAIFWNVIIDGSTGSLLVHARLRNTTAATTLSQHSITTPSATPDTDKASFGGVALFTAASGDAQTIEIQVASATSGITLGASEASILILELIDGTDIWQSSTGTTNTTSTTYSAKLTLSWTPGTAGDYLVLLSADVLSANGEAYVRTNNTGSTFVNVHEKQMLNGTTETNNYVSASRFVNVSGAQTSAIEFRVVTADSNTDMSNAYGVALRLDGFESAYWAEDRTVHTSTSATYADSASVTATPAAVDYAILAVGQTTSSASDSSIATGQKVNAAGADIGSNFTQNRGWSDYWWSWFCLRLITPAASSQTWKTQYARTVGSANAISDEHVIAVLQLEAAGPATEQKFPDAIAASTNLTGAVTDIDEDPDAADANWLTATSATAATDLRVSFPTPSGDPTSTQNFRAQVRKTTGTPTPVLDMHLYQGGTLRSTLLTGTSITSTSGQVVQGDWNADDLVTVIDGSDVECRIAGSVGSTTATGAMPAYSSTATAAASNSITTTISPAKPATVNAGDLMILQVMARNDESDGTVPASITDWNAFPGNTYGGTNNSRQGLYWRIATGSEGGQTVSLACSGSTTADLAVAKIYRFTAANGFAASPIEGITVNSGTASPVAAPTSGATPGGTNRRAVCMCAIASSDSSIGSMTGESAGNWTEAVAGNTTTGGDGTFSVQTADASSGAAVSGGSVGFTVSTSGHWNTVAFYLVPGDSVTATNTVEIGAIEWNVTYTIAEPPPQAIPAIFMEYGAVFGGAVLR